MIGQLRGILGDLIGLRDSMMPELLSEQLGGIRYCRMIRPVVNTLDWELEQKALYRKDPNQFLESRGWVGEIYNAATRTEWRKDEMQSDMRRYVLDICDTPEQVLDLLWDPDSGLQPLNKDMRIGPLKELWRVNPDQYCTVTKRQKIDVVRGPQG